MQSLNSPLGLISLSLHLETLDSQSKCVICFSISKQSNTFILEMIYSAFHTDGVIVFSPLYNAYIL